MQEEIWQVRIVGGTRTRFARVSMQMLQQDTISELRSYLIQSMIPLAPPKSQYKTRVSHCTSSHSRRATDFGCDSSQFDVIHPRVAFPCPSLEHLTDTTTTMSLSTDRIRAFRCSVTYLPPSQIPSSDAASGSQFVPVSHVPRWTLRLQVNRPAWRPFKAQYFVLCP